MASISAFNEMMGQFLIELHTTFPEEKGVKTFMNKFELLRKTNPRKCVDKYMSGIAPYVEKISNKDESFFLEEANNLDFLKDLNIQKHWSSPDITPNTKNAIWQYLQTLYMLGTTITAIPPETLSMIENIAKECASKMQDENGEMNEKALMSTMNNLLGGLMKNKP